GSALPLEETAALHAGDGPGQQGGLANRALGRGGRRRRRGDGDGPADRRRGDADTDRGRGPLDGSPLTPRPPPPERGRGGKAAPRAPAWGEGARGGGGYGRDGHRFAGRGGADDKALLAGGALELLARRVVGDLERLGAVWAARELWHGPSSVVRGPWSE